MKKMKIMMDYDVLNREVLFYHELYSNHVYSLH